MLFWLSDLFNVFRKAFFLKPIGGHRVVSESVSPSNVRHFTILKKVDWGLYLQNA